jgi:precorrin-6Y C5,15-methyltransferase (decarboxylating)
MISENRNFAGGVRHKKLVERFLPGNYKWENITVPLSKVFDAIKGSTGDWVIFASGDPLFYGIGISLKREFPDASIRVLPDFNSLQNLAHRFHLPYGEFHTISLTGRSFDELDEALIRGTSKIGVLTDRKRTPAVIVERMLEYGYSNYKIYYGECLGGEKERVLEITLEEMLKLNVKRPNCFYLEKTDNRIPKKGIPEGEFEHLKGRPHMITKMPIRLTTLSYLEFQDKRIFWDIGSCTGSISIEAKLHYPHLKVIAFEKRPESKKLITGNARKFQTPGIDLRINDYLKEPKDGLSPPDAVFLGGYGGRMKELLDDIKTRMRPGAVLAFNSVSAQSRKQFTEWCEKNQCELTVQQQISIDSHNPIYILIAEIK